MYAKKIKAKEEKTIQLNFTYMYYENKSFRNLDKREGNMVP